MPQHMDWHMRVIAFSSLQIHDFHLCTAQQNLRCTLWTLLKKHSINKFKVSSVFVAGLRNGQDRFDIMILKCICVQVKPAKTLVLRSPWLSNLLGSF